MYAIIDRIEDNKIAVITCARKGRGLEEGEMFIPAKLFPFPVYEGMHIKITFQVQPKQERKRRTTIEKLHKELRKNK